MVFLKTMMLLIIGCARIEVLLLYCGTQYQPPPPSLTLILSLSPLHFTT